MKKIMIFFVIAPYVHFTLNTKKNDLTTYSAQVLPGLF